MVWGSKREVLGALARFANVNAQMTTNNGPRFLVWTWHREPQIDLTDIFLGLAQIRLQGLGVRWVYLQNLSLLVQGPK